MDSIGGTVAIRREQRGRVGVSCCSDEYRVNWG